MPGRRRRARCIGFYPAVNRALVARRSVVDFDCGPVSAAVGLNYVDDSPIRITDVRENLAIGRNRPEVAFAACSQYARYAAKPTIQLQLPYCHAPAFDDMSRR